MESSGELSPKVVLAMALKFMDNRYHSRPSIVVQSTEILHNTGTKQSGPLPQTHIRQLESRPLPIKPAPVIPEKKRELSWPLRAWIDNV